MTRRLYRTASEIPSVMADPATLDPHAVRCLWARPVLDRNNAPAFMPVVVFEDDTDCPLACEMDSLHARQTCQRIGAAYDWPVRDHRPTDSVGDGKAQAMRLMASLPDNEVTIIDGQRMVSTTGAAEVASRMAYDNGVPYGIASEHSTTRFRNLLTDMCRKSEIQPHKINGIVSHAVETLTARLADLYKGERPEPQITGSTPEQLGEAVADYGRRRGFDDMEFREALAVSMSATDEIWRDKDSLTQEQADAMNRKLMDAGLKRWLGPGRLKNKERTEK